MPIPRDIVREVTDLWTVAAAASRTSTRAHTTLRGARKDVPGLAAIATDCQAVQSCANGSEVGDTAANVFLTELHRIVYGIGSHPGVPGRKVGVVFAQTYYQPGPGSITTGYTVNDIAERSFRHIETLYPERGVFDLDLLIVPINTPGHWCLGVVDFEHDRFELYDTLLKDSPIEPCHAFATHMTKFFAAYAAERPLVGLKDMVVPRFDAFARLVNTGLEGEKGPIQRDGTSCGVFMLAIAMFRARGWALCLAGEDAADLRTYVTYTIAAEKEHDSWPAARKLLAERVRMPPPRRAPPPRPIPSKAVSARDAIPRHRKGDEDVKFIGTGVVERQQKTPRYTAMFGAAAAWDTDNPAKRRRVHTGVTFSLREDAVEPPRSDTWTPNPGVVEPEAQSRSGVSRSAYAFPSKPPPTAPRVAPVDTAAWLDGIRAAPPASASTAYR